MLTQDILPGEGSAPSGLFSCDTHPLSKFFSKDSWDSARWRASLPQLWYIMGWELHQFSVIKWLVKLVLRVSLIIAQRGDRNIPEMAPSTQWLHTYHIPCIFRYRENICFVLMNGHLKPHRYIWLRNTKIPSCSYPINWYSYKHIRLYSYNDISLYHIYQVTNG